MTRLSWTTFFFFAGMKYLAAYLLAQLSGAQPTPASVTKILKAGGVEVDEARVKALFTQVEGKDVNALMEAGRKKMVALPAAGAAPAAGESTQSVPREEKKNSMRSKTTKLRCNTSSPHLPPLRSCCPRCFWRCPRCRQEGGA